MQVSKRSNSRRADNPRNLTTVTAMTLFVKKVSATIDLPPERHSIHAPVIGQTVTHVLERWALLPLKIFARPRAIDVRRRR